MVKTPWTDERVASARRALADGDPVADVAYRAGCSPGALREKFRREGLPAPSEVRALGPDGLVRSPVVADPSALDDEDRTGDQPKFYAILSDVHVPYHDEAAVEAICGLLRELRPDGLIVAGDFLDLIEVSRHAAGSVAKLEGKRISRSFSEGRRVLGILDRAAGRGCREKILLEGNHEHRLTRWLESGDNAVFLDDEAVSVPGRLGLADRGWEWRPGYPTAHVRLGHLLVTHGRWCGQYPAAVHLNKFRHSVIFGHTHTCQTHHGPGFGRQQAGFAQGHLADERSEAMRYAPVPNNWRKGFSVVVLEPSGNFHVQMPTFVDGAFWFGARRYGQPPARASS